ncbi:hypothetical protein CCR95_18045 [Thiocystis minor]|nr:type II toxin-antitoxin system HigB family toxin [Thiocystis minor]MBK5965924.1 hypothetical protein [Thiocystis minor]
MAHTSRHQSTFSSARILKGRRVVFKLKGNDDRLVVALAYMAVRPATERLCGSNCRTQAERFGMAIRSECALVC